MMSQIENGLCSLCGGEIKNTQVVGSWKNFDGGGGLICAGCCSICDVDFRLLIGNRRPGIWQLDAPDPAELRSELDLEELSTLTTKFGRYEVLGPKWKAFLARSRAGDKVWRFRSQDGLHNGFAVVRDGVPVSRFVILSPM